MRVLRDLLLLLMFVICRVVAEETSDGEVDFSGKWQVLYRLVQDCTSKSEPGACLKLKLLTFLDRVYAIQEPLMLTDYLVLVKDPDVQDEEQRSAKRLSQTELQTVLTQSPERKNEILDDMLSQRVDAFFNSRSIQLNIPMDDVTGRAKKKKKKKLLKKIGIVLLALKAILAVKAILAKKLLFVKIALIAGKALLIGKIALVVSAVVLLLRKLKGGGGGKGAMGGGGEDEITAQVIYASPEHEHHMGGGSTGYGGGGYGGGGGGYGGGGGGHGGGGGGGDGWWRRRNIQDAHDLAYSAYRSFNDTATPNLYGQH